MPPVIVSFFGFFQGFCDFFWDDTISVSGRMTSSDGRVLSSVTAIVAGFVSLSGEIAPRNQSGISSSVAVVGTHSVVSVSPSFVFSIDSVVAEINESFGVSSISTSSDTCC